MNKLKTFIVAFVSLMASTAFAQTIAPTEKYIQIEAGKQAPVTFEVINETDVKPALAEFFLYLPEGITVAYDDDEEDYIYEKVSSMLIKSHSVTVTQRADSSWYIMVKNESGKEFKATSGEYLTLTLEAASTFHGTEEARMTDIHLVKLDTSKFQSETENSFYITTETVGINAINADGTNEPVYNTAGQRVRHMGKGLFIQNGKKVVKK